MKIIVCIKVADGEINPFDECALEAALSVKDSEVTILSMCPPSAKDVLLPLTRLGVKRVVLLCDSCFAGSDTLATGYILAEAIKKIDYDMIFCGRQTIDGETAQVGPCLSAFLGISLITNVLEIADINDRICCKTRMGNEAADVPALLTVERINKLRFPSIRSKIGEIEVWDNSIIGADANLCGLSGSPTRVIKTFENKKSMRKCTFLEKEDFVNLVLRLSNQAKKAKIKEESEVKLTSAWVVGEEVKSEAERIAENVRVIEKMSPEKIAELIKNDKPEVVLWGADLWGRKNAPICAALLKTGLCADCTELETDGKKLYMIRPAKGGNITAKIKCETMPQMATVRISEKHSSDIIVSAGRGAADNIETVRKIAEFFCAEMCASRGLVDTGKVPYELQVGLTGKRVSPKIYIAIGISGAVHHIVGMENADFVIAVNPDKDAEIFNYADFGVICRAEELMEINEFEKI